MITTNIPQNWLIFCTNKNNFSATLITPQLSPFALFLPNILDSDKTDPLSKAEGKENALRFPPLWPFAFWACLHSMPRCSRSAQVINSIMGNENKIELSFQSEYDLPSLYVRSCLTTMHGPWVVYSGRGNLVGQRGRACHGWDRSMVGLAGGVALAADDENGKGNGKGSLPA